MAHNVQFYSGTRFEPSPDVATEGTRYPYVPVIPTA